MRALFIGVGSIGKRHIRDFYSECQKHGVNPIIHVLRRQIGDLGDIDAYVSKQLTELTKENYDVVFITNPTFLHFDALLKCKGKADYYFIEKPIFDCLDYSYNDLDINAGNSYIAAPMRHTKLFKTLKSIVRSEGVFSARVVCSSYLPEWRPNIDYRKNYSAIKEMGGGVNLDLIHEIDYVYDLFGEPINCFSLSGKYSNLEITSNDIGIYILQHEKSLCEIHLDYFGREYTRTCEIYTSKGKYTADFHREVLIYPNGNQLNCHVQPNEEFIEEMEYFYDFISGKVTSINPPEVALKNLKIALKGALEI